MGFARKLSVALLVVASLGLTAYAQRGEVALVRPPKQGVTFAAPWRPAGGTDTKVVGSVIDIRQVPVPGATVQLRDLKTGAVVAKAETDAQGEYVFDTDVPGAYVVEMVMVDNVVVALSNAGSLGHFQTLQTVIQLPGRWDFGTRTMIVPVAPTSFFGIGAASTMTSTTLGMAIDQNVRPTDPGEPVSPR